MPSIEDIIAKKKEKDGKFKKKSYRPWNLDGSKTVDNNDNSDNTETGHKKTKSKYTTSKKNKKIPTTVSKSKSSSSVESFEEEIQKSTVIEQEMLIGSANNKNEQIPPNINGLGHDQRIITKYAESLTGKQLELMISFVAMCTQNSSNCTGRIITASFCKERDFSINTFKVSIRRLVKKGLIKRGASQSSRGGFLKLEVSQEVQQSIIGLNFENLISVGEMSKPINVVSPKNIPDEWNNIYVPDLVSDIGFGIQQIRQILSTGKNAADIVQESLYHFEFALKYSEKIKEYENPLNVFMGVLRKGDAWIESKYRSNQEIAQENLLKINKEKINRLQLIEKELHDSVLALQFEEWKYSLAESEKQKYIASFSSGIEKIMPDSAKLYQYFKDNIAIGN